MENNGSKGQEQKEPKEDGRRESLLGQLVDMQQS
jgi:hypothetical protein